MASERVEGKEGEHWILALDWGPTPSVCTLEHSELCGSLLRKGRLEVRQQSPGVPNTPPQYPFLYLTCVLHLLEGGQREMLGLTGILRCTYPTTPLPHQHPLRPCSSGLWSFFHLEVHETGKGLSSRIHAYSTYSLPLARWSHPSPGPRQVSGQRTWPNPSLHLLTLYKSAPPHAGLVALLLSSVQQDKAPESENPGPGEAGQASRWVP